MATKTTKSNEAKQVVVIARPPGSNWARVLFGTLADRTGDSVTLRDARQALYYSRETGGELGLASAGPAKGSRITAAVAHVEVSGIGIVMEATEQAAQAWRDAPVYAGVDR